MPIPRTVCPECKVSLKSTDPGGFTLGQSLDCPKCGTTFAVAAPAKPAKPRVLDDDEPPRKKARVVDDEEEDDRPRKRRRRDDDEDEDEDDRPRRKRKTAEGGYRTSPLRFIVLGILVVIMLVLGFLLYQKWQREKEEAGTPTPQTARPV